MTDLETRLRRDLPELAETMLRDVDVAPLGEVGDPATYVSAARLDDRARRAGATPTSPRRCRWTVGVAVAAVAVLIAGAVGLLLVDGDSSDTGVVTQPDSGWGTWGSMPDAPFDARRAYPVTVWTGDEVVVWGGTNLGRSFADTGGGAYDPATNAWREVTGPSWGHPGLAGAYFDGYIYLVAKGGGSRFAPGDTESDDLPLMDAMSIVAAAATDDGLWVVGPASDEPIGPTDLGVARYEPSSGTWSRGPVLPVGQDRTYDWATLTESPPVWTGSEILVWNPAGYGAAFDPAAQTWRDLPALDVADGTVVTSTVVANDDHIVALARVDEGTTDATRLATLGSEGWRWHATDLPAVDLDRSIAVGAGEHVMLLRPEAPPIAIEPAAGVWHAFGDSPLVPAEAPGAVWTGEQLVVWGGIPSGSSSDEASHGAVWTPPSTGDTRQPDDEPDSAGAISWLDHESDGVALSTPPSWKVSDEDLTPPVVDPRVVLSAGTGTLVPGGGDLCSQFPMQAVDSMGPGGALLVVFERAGPPGRDVAVRTGGLWEQRGRPMRTCRRSAHRVPPSSAAGSGTSPTAIAPCTST